ncbi:hypothetical protein BU17DRAFT_67363 [Hysterangium stoloniferum]|nr:hypothetical protein BU17DRAFT_67363 [Hysterangium stoloniferum]
MKFQNSTHCCHTLYPFWPSSGIEYILITSKAFSVFYLKASSKHPGQFQDIFNLFLLQHLSNIQDIFNYQNFLLTAGTSDILQDSWSSSNAIQKAFYKACIVM